MVVRLVWSPEARKDLLDIYVVIGLENPAAAERLYDRIEANAETLSHHPRLGRRRPDIQPCATTARSIGARSCASSTAGATWRG
jgi:toxin ParE1/3/4